MTQRDEMSFEDRPAELVHLAIDGIATSEERRELNRILSTSPSLRLFYKDMLRLSGELDALRHGPVPSGLQSEITSAIQRSQHRIASPAADRRRFFAYAWAAAASLVLLFGIHNFVSQRGSEPGVSANAAGSLAPATPNWAIVARFSARDLEVVVRRRDGLYALEPTATGTAPTGNIALRWSGDQITGLSATGGASLVDGGADFVPQPAPAARVIVRRLAAPAEVAVHQGGKEALRFSLPRP